MAKMVKITTKNEVSIIDYSNNLDVMRKEIECDWIEIVRPRGLPQGYVMVIDEEGKLKDCPRMNIIGSYLYQTHVHGEPIVGNLLLLREVYGDEGYEFAGLTDEMAKFLKTMCEKFLEVDTND